MFNSVSENRMHLVRWILAVAWLILIFSLFYDPISPILTHPQSTWSPLNLEHTDAITQKLTGDTCVRVQGECLEQIPYALGAPVFWGIIVPAAIFILLIFGHELWRRICPLSFFSQIPRRLNRQRQHERKDAKTGKIRYELAKVPKNSWLANNYLYLQLGLFYIGITSRILFVNSHRVVLGTFLLGTIAAAIAVGYYYGGKSWCNYFCPMSPVQKIYGEPRGLLNSAAHEGEKQTITQSMCRTVNPEGKELSACVACQSPCMDIDAERAYWDGLTQPDRQWLYYGYVGLVVGYFSYYYLYAGNWEYYLSGVWAHEQNPLGNLLRPGLYLWGNPIPIPKIVAAPLVIALCGYLGYFIGCKLEKAYKAYLLRHNKLVNTELVRHRLFTLCAFLIFNFFFIFGGRNFIRLLPSPLSEGFSVFLAACSGLWLYRTWGRNPGLYQRESLASRLRKQLQKLNLNIARFLEGRSLDDLHADEIYVLAKILPGFDEEKRLQAYKGILKESIDEGYVDTQSSREILQQIRLELNISDKEHDLVLKELAIEDPLLLDPAQPQTHEDYLRQESYREALLTTLQEATKNHPNQNLVAELFDVMTGTKPFSAFDELLQNLTQEETKAIDLIREEYTITPEEEKEILIHADPRQLWQNVSNTFEVLTHLDDIFANRKQVTKTLDWQDAEHIAYCQEVFKKFDMDGNNRLSVAELRAVLRSAGRPYAAQRIQEVMDAITGHPNSDSLSFEEFASLLYRDLDKTPEEKLRERFELFDADNSGHITLEELRVCLQGLDFNLSDAEVEAMLIQADTSKDGQISYEEFCKAFHNLGG